MSTLIPFFILNPTLSLATHLLLIGIVASLLALFNLKNGIMPLLLGVVLLSSNCTLIVLTLVFPSLALASASLTADPIDIEAVTNLAVEAQNFVVKDLGSQNINKPRLLVFVSSSMPRSLLKTYAMEAKNYDGALVFKGLPGGSFKELSQLMTEIYDNQNDFAGSIIDDEAFRIFGVTTVPSVVLSVEEECFEQQNCKIIYDKVVGNIGIKTALKKFQEEGDMRSAAAQLLRSLYD